LARNKLRLSRLLCHCLLSFDRSSISFWPAVALRGFLPLAGAAASLDLALMALPFRLAETGPASAASLVVLKPANFYSNQFSGAI
jgi:hypothetical protein